MLERGGGINLMKRLILFAFLLLLPGFSAHAVELRISGSWVMSFGYGENGAFQGAYKGHQFPGWEAGQDKLAIQERLKLQLHAFIDHNLSSFIGFEMGGFTLGNYSEGAALGADRAIVQLSSAWLDWNMPKAPVKVRMGLQSIATPAMASGNSVLNGAMAGVATSVKLAESLFLTAVWGRPYNDNYPGHNGLQRHYLDNMDVGGLFLPLDLECFNFTPWVLYAAVGPNFLRGDVSASGYPFGNGNLASSASYLYQGLFPAGGARHRDFSDANSARQLTGYGNGWWAGFSCVFKGLEPFRLSMDAEGGSMAWSDDWRLLRAGWFATLLLEYNLDWGAPGLYGWFGSGDDGNPANGSERMPAPDPDNSCNYSRFAFDGAPYLERNALIANNLAGTWGIGLRLAELALTENWRQTLRVNLICGTNSPAMAKKMSLAGLWANGFELEPNFLGNGSNLGLPGVYLTTLDKALEVGATSCLKLGENFAINVEAAYIALWLDTGSQAWGARHREGQSIPQTRDAWNVNATFVFSF